MNLQQSSVRPLNYDRKSLIEKNDLMSKFIHIYSGTFFQSLSTPLYFRSFDWWLLVKASCDGPAWLASGTFWGLFVFVFPSSELQFVFCWRISYHMCLWSRALPERDCPLGTIHVTFVDILLLFYWGDMGLLSLDNSLPVSVVLVTGWQPIFIGWRFSSLLLSCRIYWFFREADFMYKYSLFRQTCL